MNRFKLLTLASCCALVLAFITIIVQAQENEPIDTNEPINTQATEALAGPGFSYQGRLDDASGPVTNTCDFQFSLWDGSTGGSQIGSTETLGNIVVDEGVFSSIINSSGTFGNNPFTGEERFLQVAVRCPASSGEYATLIPRQTLTPVPYAMSLPGVYPDGIGKVGIGTDSPEQELHVKSSSGHADLRLENFSGTKWNIAARDDDNSLRIVATGSGTPMTIERWGHIGIGTTSPSAPLHIKEDSNDGTTMILDAVSSANPDVSFRLNGSFAGRIRIARDREEMDFTVANNNGRETWVMSLAPDHVRLPVLRIVGGSDLSEKFDVSESKMGQEPVPGSVTCIDAENPGKLIVCHQAYDPRVAGIISGAGDVDPGNDHGA